MATKATKATPVSAIAKIYARRIERGTITIDDVPEKIRAEVESLLG